jgi:hypothetical protein
VTAANLVMLALGITALAIGLALLLRRGGGEAAIYARRIAGMMIAALGLFLTIFALGLSPGVRSFLDA